MIRINVQGDQIGFVEVNFQTSSYMEFEHNIFDALNNDEGVICILNDGVVSIRWHMDGLTQ